MLLVLSVFVQTCAQALSAASACTQAGNRPDGGEVVVRLLRNDVAQDVRRVAARTALWRQHNAYMRQ